MILFIFGGDFFFYFVIFFGDFFFVFFGLFSQQ